MPLPEVSKLARFDPVLDEGFIRLHFVKLPREQRHPLTTTSIHKVADLTESYTSPSLTRAHKTSRATRRVLYSSRTSDD